MGVAVLCIKEFRGLGLAFGRRGGGGFRKECRELLRGRELGLKRIDINVLDT